MIALVAIAGVFGLLIGSFLNVVVYRVPRGLSVVRPPSSCPGCGTPIAAHDNVPVLSWLVLRGRCRNCSMRISARYPLVELATGIAFAVVAAAFGGPVLEATTVPAVVAAALVLVALLYFAAVSIALALIDIDVHRLPNAIVLPSIVVAVVLLGGASIALGSAASLVVALIGGAALALAYLAMAFAYPGGMGLGDVKLAAVVGLYLGWMGWGALVVGSLAAFILGGLFGLALVIAKRARRTTGIPFGPWMLAGAWIGILIGNDVAASYLGLFGLK